MPHGREVFNTSTAEEIAVALGDKANALADNYAGDGIVFKKLAKATYDFDVDAGAISAIGLGVTIPSGATVQRAWINVLTTLTSGTDAGTVAISIEGANDVVTATAISAGGNIWDAGLHEGIEDGTTANMVVTTDDREITATIAVEAVTAGKFEVIVEYVM